MEELLVQAVSGQGGRPAGKHHVRFGALTVGTKVVELMKLLKCLLGWKLTAGDKTERRISSSDQEKKYYL